MDTDSLDSLILSNPFLTQNTEMWPASHLRLDQSLVVQVKSFINEIICFPDKFNDSGFKFFSLFFFQQDSTNVLTTI